MRLYDVRLVSAPHRPILIAAEVSVPGLRAAYTILATARPGYPPSAWWPYPPRELTAEEKDDASREAVRLARTYAAEGETSLGGGAS